MSAKRSWDVRREPRSAPEAPVRTRRESLKERRKKQRRVLFIVLGVLAAVLFAALVYLMWQPFVRINSIATAGPNAEETRAIAEAALEGTYFYVLPKNSIFIFPEGAMRRKVLDTYPAVTAVAIKRTGFTSISLTNVPRTSAFIWCGATAGTASPCYQADAEGFVFALEEGYQEPVIAMQMEAATAPEAKAAPVEPIVEDVDMSVLRIYAPLEGAEGETPIRAHVVGAGRLPDALRFVKAMKSLNVGIVSVEIREDEADLYTPEGTRITYILGREKAAADLAASAFPTLNIGSGELEYVDLRFKGKVYVKRIGEAAAL
ncbi:MAG TPA: hypothetical protein VEA92_02350 [Candidatus Paceibacterota bacterium]|nr:hypothetical protein [Candidatus Paceibacterota bacterium]